jgi:hypothetical protein
MKSTNTVYQEMRDHGLVLGHFESDLYVRDTPPARAVLTRHGCDDWRPFHDPRDHRALCVPFAYDPWWERAKAADRQAQAPDEDPIRVTGVWEAEPRLRYLVRVSSPVLRIYEISHDEPIGPRVQSLEDGFNLDEYLDEADAPGVQLYDCPAWVNEALDTVREFCVN